MTLVIGVCGKDFLVTGADTRGVDISSGDKIIDNAQKIFGLKDSIYFSFSGQKLIPAAILQNYNEDRIQKPHTFTEFVEIFSKLAIHIRENTPYSVADNQFVIYGFDDENTKFRVVIFHSDNNYQPNEQDTSFFALGNEKYMDWDNYELQNIYNNPDDPIEKSEKLLIWMQEALDKSYNKEKDARGCEPHISTTLRFVCLNHINGVIEKKECLQ